MALSLSPTTYYTLTNSYTGPNFPIAILPGSPGLELRVAPADDSTLLWHFLATQDPTKYNICTTYNSNSYCLDILGGDSVKTTPRITTPGSFSGQQWTLTPAGGYYKMSNDYSPDGYFLDIFSGSDECVMTTGNFTGQYWSLNNKQVTSSTVSSTSFSTSSTPVSPGPTSPTPNKDSGTSATSSSGNGGVSADGKLGMEVGLGVGIPAIVIALLAWLVPRRARMR